MRSANPSAPLQGLRLYKALLGLIQASGLAGGFDLPHLGFPATKITAKRAKTGELLRFQR